MKRAGRIDHRERVRPAHDVVGRCERVDPGHLELGVLKRRQTEVGVDLTRARAQRCARIRRVHADSERIEAGEFGVTECLGGSHLQEAGLDGDFNRAHSDLVPFGQILHCLQIGIAGVEQQRHGRFGTHAFHPDP